MANESSVTPAGDDENLLLTSLNRYQSLLGTLNGIVWEADAATGRHTFISDGITPILGYNPADFLTHHHFWEDHVFPADREYAIAQRQGPNAPRVSFDYRMLTASGSIVWIRDRMTVEMQDGTPKTLRGIMVDITETRLLADLDNLEKQVLRMNAQNGTAIEAVLNFYVLGIEVLFPQMKCSILRVTGNKLNNWASPSLPPEYTAAIRDKEAGPLAGSCGAAVHYKRQIIASDIDTDEVWAAHKHYPLAHNLRASWSYPVIGSSGNVMATFGIYYSKVTHPDAWHLGIIERTAELLRIIIENHEYAYMMKEANTLISQGQALANFGTWQWDIVKDVITWSEVLYAIYGLDSKTFKATFAGYVERLHPDDREEIQQIIGNALTTRQDTMFEERIIRPDGEVIYLKSWARVVVNDAGEPIKMIGACLDVTHAKTTRQKMDEIAWMQSHVIRAPLARLMGLVDILREEIVPAYDPLGLLNNITETAKELDKVIHSISDSTRN